MALMLQPLIYGGHPPGSSGLWNILKTLQDKWIYILYQLGLKTLAVGYSPCWQRPASGGTFTSRLFRTQAELQKSHPHMSGSLLPISQPPRSIATRGEGQRTALGPRGQPPLDGSDEPALQWHRYLAAAIRYKWMILAITLGGTALGIFGTRFLPLKYEAQATIWVASAPGNEGPVRAQEILEQQGWAELVKSFTVLDTVVQQERLYVTYRPEAAELFQNFAIADLYVPGRYHLEATDGGRRYTLSSDRDSVIETGAAGDSVGRPKGLRWQPSAASLNRLRSVRFLVLSPREAAVDLQKRLIVILPSDGNFMRLTLRDVEPVRVTRALNAVLDHFIFVASDLKAFKLRETSRILEDQLASVGLELRNAEGRLERYKTAIITLPSAATPVAPGLSMTQPTVINQYFNEKIDADRLQREREVLRKVVVGGDAGALNVAGLQAIEAVRLSPQLMQALTDLSTAETELRALQLHYTDQARQVQTARERIDGLRTRTIPDQLRLVLGATDYRIQEINSHLTLASHELQSIPTRMITEQRLERERASLAGIYTDLQARYQSARLAEATAIPDVKILDRAVQPHWPTSNKIPLLVALGFFLSLGGGLALALLLDQFDKRVQYPEQVTESLGLAILGAIPAIKRRKEGDLPPDQAAQFIEAFRTVRLNLAHAFGTGPVSLTISSPSPGDGKSLVSSNLAVSFASAGYRTVLVDGDIRRGEMHRMFGTDRRPGLLEYLQGEATLDEVIRPADQQGLWIIPCGSRRQHGPELLGSGAMQQLLNELKERYNAVLVDSPPLGVGVDPFVLSAATGNLVLVVRSGETDRRLAEAKLGLVDRLPIRVLGAVLNDVRAQGAYRYYSYLYGYSVEEETETARLPAPGGNGHN